MVHIGTLGELRDLNCLVARFLSFLEIERLFDVFNFNRYVLPKFDGFHFI